MFIYRRRRFETEGRSLWFLGVRTLVCAVVLGAASIVLRKPAAFDFLLIAYAFSTALTFLGYLFLRRYGFRRFFDYCLVIQFITELSVETAITAYSGGASSPFFALFLLTIVSAALSYRLIGTLLVATAAAVAYVAGIPLQYGAPTGADGVYFWQAWTKGTDELFYMLFVRICIFYLVAFISGYLAQRLEHKTDALASTSRALEAAKTETGEILKHLRSGLLTINDDGAVAYFNQAAEDILKIRGPEVRGKSIAAAFGDRFPELADRLARVFQDQQGDVRGEIEVKIDSGQIVPLGISTSMMSSTGQRRGVIAVFQDITEAKSLEERLRLKDRLAAIGELAAGIAHEIRNPLAAISGSAEVLIGELDVQDENRHLLELIVTESARLNDIITEFLFYSRLRPTVLGRVQLGPVVDEVREIVTHHPNFKPGLTLRIQLVERDVLLQADEDHLKQVLLNLVMNSVEAFGERTGQILITSREAEAADLPEPETTPDGKGADSVIDPARWLRLTVSDDGPGIAPDIREKIWQPFFSTKSSGTGLGLAVVRCLVENLAGQIEVQSTPGKHTAVHIYLKTCPPPRKPSPLKVEAAGLA